MPSAEKNQHVQDIPKRLRAAGLRPTRQRVSLAELLYSKGHRHVTAEMLHEEAVLAKVPVSLATVYNTLHQLTDAGLLRAVAADGSKTYFDTNVSDHHHFYCMETGSILDIPNNQMQIVGLPDAPAGMEIRSVDVIVRVSERKT